MDERPSSTVDATVDETPVDACVGVDARAPNPAWTTAPWASISTSKRPKPTTSRLGLGLPPRRARAIAEDARGDATVDGDVDVDVDADAEDDDEGEDDDVAAADVEARHWRECFRRCSDVDAGTTRGTFRVYSNDAIEPSSREEEEVDAAPSPPPVCFLLHGCPHTALSWGSFAEEFERRAKEDPSSICARVDVVAMDLRGHGESRCDEDSEPTFDPDVMARDAFETLRAYVATLRDGGERARRVVVVGHSMGGAIATRVATLVESGDQSSTTLAGLVLIDIVEGSALRALPAMGAMVDARPTEFSSLRDAMRWSATRGGGTTNARSAALSLPSQLRREDAEDGRRRYVWRTDVRATAPFWRAWYEGLSRKFLAVRAAKLLVLAGNDRLDTELTVAQMQGKFQLVLLPRAGHAVHEDAPEETATALENFFARYVLNARPTPPPFVV